MSVSPLPNVAALLATGWGRVRLSDRSQEMAAALIEAADALRHIDFVLTTVGGDNYPRGESPKMHAREMARAALARLVAFDASLEKTT